MTPHGCITASPEIRAGVFSLPARPPNICLWPDSPLYTHISYVIRSNCYSFSRKCFISCSNDRAFRCTQTILHIDLFLTFKNAGALIEVDRISLHTQRTNHRTNISNTISCRNLLCCKFWKDLEVLQGLSEFSTFS